MEKNKQLKIRRFLVENVVTIVFVVLCLFGIYASKLPLPFVVQELLVRIGRNTFLVMSLIIPVIAGMGLNFGITIGAMAAQIVMIFAVQAGIVGLGGFLLCAILVIPLSALFGYFVGKILNKTEGQEMITSMMLGFFANGLYQLFFLVLVGTLIPMKDPNLMIPGGIGVKNTVELTGSLKYVLDKAELVIGNLSLSFEMVLPTFLIVIGIIGIVCSIYLYRKTKKLHLDHPLGKYIFYLVLSMMSIVLSILIQLIPSLMMYRRIKVPTLTFLVILAVAFFNVVIFRTKLGQDFRTVGQSKKIAHVSGINVPKVRIKSIMISTVLAAWGQMIFLQNLGNINTYGSHVQIGTFAVAAILIGGASVSKATIGQAFLGVILFHTLFIVSPSAGKHLFNNAQLGEYFRTFVAYGVIALSLVLHAWKKNKMKQSENVVDLSDDIENPVES